MITVFKPSMDDQEVKAVERVLKSGWIGLGPETELLEKNLETYLGSQHIITTNSATAALHLALIVAGVTEGDEVISPAFTFISTNSVILYQRATAVFCDIEPDTLCANPNDIIKKITPKTKAIIVVHYGGHAVDLDPLLKICKEKGIVLIEDAAHAFGGEYKGQPLGTIGTLGSYSFHAVKGIAMGDGGAVFTKDEEIAKRLKRLRWMGISKDTWSRSDREKFSWEYEVVELGYKYHTNDILAAIGNVQLRKFPKTLKRRQEIYERYKKELANISWLTIPTHKSYTTAHGAHNFWVQTHYRNELNTFLAEKGIATTVHYEPNSHYQIFAHDPATVKSTKLIPVTEKASQEILLLPLHAELTDKEVDFIISSVQSFKP